MWPRFDSQTWCHMWVEFVVGSCPCSGGFSPGSLVFFPPQKSTLLNSNWIWKHAQLMKNHFVEMPLQICIIVDCHYYNYPMYRLTFSLRKKTWVYLWLHLARACVHSCDLRWLVLTLVKIKFAGKSKQVFHRLATQSKSMQVDQHSLT